MKLKYDKLLSSFAFNLNLRHYMMGALYGVAGLAHAADLLGGAVQVDSIKTRVESAPGFSACD